MHLNLPDGNTMLGSECGGYQMMTAMDEQVQVYLPIIANEQTIRQEHMGSVLETSSLMSQQSFIG